VHYCCSSIQQKYSNLAITKFLGTAKGAFDSSVIDHKEDASQLDPVMACHTDQCC